MYYFKTYDSDGFIRIEESCSASITLRIYDGIAKIVSVFVPGDERRNGIGTTLIFAAENEACKNGALRIEADYSSEIEGMSDFLEIMGYELSDNGALYSLDISDVLSSDAVKNFLKKNFTGVSYSSLEELEMDRWDELFDSMAKLSLRLKFSDMKAFSKRLSGAVYDNDGVLQAVILCSEQGETVNVELLVTIQRENSICAMAALQGMLMEIYSSGGRRRYSGITAYCVQDSMVRIMERVLSKQPAEIGKALYAVKELESKEHYTKIDEELDEDVFDDWRREISRVSMQENIEWKAAWYRERGRKKTDIKNSDTKSSEEAENTTYADDVSNVADLFPYELSDPLDIDYGFDKDEDETEGLLCSSIRRITADNLDEFRDVLPGDALQDITRPWFRGLSFYEGADVSFLVYELKNIDSEEDSDSEIKWFSIEPDAKELLDEYTNEAGNAGVQKTVIEAALSKETEEFFSGAGFDIDEQESDTIVVTVGDLMKLPFASKKTADYVRALGDVSERQFKRMIGRCMLNNRRGILNDLEFLPMEWFDQDVSSVVITDERVSGVLLVHQLASRRLSVDLLYSCSGDAKIDIQRMIIRSVRKAAEKYPKETPVLIRRHDRKVHAIAEKLFPDMHGEKILHGEREEK